MCRIFLIFYLVAWYCNGSQCDIFFCTDEIVTNKYVINCNAFQEIIRVQTNFSFRWLAQTAHNLNYFFKYSVKFLSHICHCITRKCQLRFQCGSVSYIKLIPTNTSAIAHHPMSTLWWCIPEAVKNFQSELTSIIVNVWRNTMDQCFICDLVIS